MAKEETDKPTIDFKLATIRRDCLIEAVKACSDPDMVVILADKMYRFVIGEPITTEKGWK